MLPYINGIICPQCHGLLHDIGDGTCLCEDCGNEFLLPLAIDASYCDEE